MPYKLKVKVPFTDKFTGESHIVGDVIDVEKARGDELLADSRRLVEVVDKPTTRKRTEKKQR